MMPRRAWLLGLAGCAAAAASPAAFALTSTPVQMVRLSQSQSRIFQSWMLRIIVAQLERGPSPRWQQRDCAGLVRFAVNEAFAPHDARWLRANGVGHDGRLPPELALTEAQAALRIRWVQGDGAVGNYVNALGLVHNNARFVTREVGQALAGDLLLFEQGDQQHLMVCMGHRIGYHNGTVSATDNGLRSVGIDQLMNWRDTRWQPASNNPNFAGIHRLSFLT
jgi:uncharacterized protein YfaT (DUF1175 family)